jgi:hypothetical protein
MVTVVPGVNTNLNDVVSGTATTQFPIHGGRNNEGRLMIDGLNIGNPPGGNQPASYIADVGNAQEVTFTTAGGLGESETAGLVMNVVPKTGGNSTTGSVAYSGSGEALQSDNYTDELKAQGADDADSADQGLRPQRRGRRADYERSHLVLRERPHAGKHEEDCKCL